MFVAVLGNALDARILEDRESKVKYTQLTVVVGDKPLNVRLESGQVFRRFDLVVLWGDLGVFERRYYVNQARVRLASASDLAFFGTVDAPALVGGDELMEGVEDEVA